MKTLNRCLAGVLGVVREMPPGFLHRYHLERITWMDELVARHGIRRALTVADLKAAHAAGQPAIILDTEGLDFLERKLERLEESYQRGLRHIAAVRRFREIQRARHRKEVSHLMHFHDRAPIQMIAKLADNPLN